ncbi:MAG: hypothetical protein P1U56_11510 [Saprospiraceae bacterium]|nr:hypothetical protein [Saprospiraceae bacterium]
MRILKTKVNQGLLFIIIGLAIYSCKSNKSMQDSGFKNDFMGISALSCSEEINPNAIDSKVGTINCTDITMVYDYGKFSNAGPLTPIEEFTRSFDTYHHIKFFEDRMIDPKVYKIFLDSVEINTVRLKTQEDKLMFPCTPCNTTAELTFMGETYLFPTTLSESQLNMNGYTTSFEENDGFIYKYYQEDNQLPGLYISPKNNRYKNKNTLSLTVTQSTLPMERIDEVLKSVYIIQK